MSDILVEPGAVHDDPPPRPETRTDPETQPEADDRLRRDAAAKRRVDEANVERRKKGPPIGMNWFFTKQRQELDQEQSLLLGIRQKETSTSFLIR